jgi:tetratricopeptide (TPR) repeat protein
MNPRRPDPAACLLALLLSAPALPGHAQPASADVRPVGAAEARRYVLSRTPEELARAEASGPLASESDKLAAEAVRLIQRDRLTEASRQINAALRMRIDRSYYHLINGLIYHLQARRGDAGAFDLAEQGYKQALQFDDSNWQAHYFAGLLDIDQSRFQQAAQRLAEAMYLNPEDAGLLNAFAYAAYRAGAPDVAAGAVQALESMGGLKTTAELRNGALVMAAVGEWDQAREYVRRLQQRGDAAAGGRVERRVQDWRAWFDRAQMQKVQFGAPAAPGGMPMGGGMPGQPMGAPAPAPTAPGTENKMVVVDVVIISTEEDFADSKGTNLLRGLQIQFGGASGPAYSRNFSSSTSGSSTGGVAAPDTGSSTLAVTRSITLPSITYSLNIFNMSSARNEILARPTLVATAGKPSEFFSGAELNAVVVNSSNNSSASPVNIQKDIGTTLSIVPTFLEDGRVSMKVTAQRTFIKTPNSNLTGFDARVETSKSKVDASVVMRPGETLILSGLSEKEGETTRDGVPLLQDIPGLQYLFARSTSRSYQKSTLILVTPRPPQYVYQSEKARVEYEKSLSEDERPFASLRSRYADWFRPYPNWASIFHHLQENARYREFRTGDVALENWTDMRSLRDRLNKVVEFLHY